MDKNYRIVVLLVLCMATVSCRKQKGTNASTTDYFYTQTGSFDLHFLPLLKPYRLITPARETGWFFELPYGQIESLISNSIGVNKIGVKDSTIIIQTDEIYVKHKMQQAWFIVDLKTKTESVLTAAEEYNNYLHKKGLQDLQLYLPDKVYQRFLDKGTLPFDIESKATSVSHKNPK